LVMEDIRQRGFNEIRSVDFRKLEALRLDQGLAKMEFCRKAGISDVTYRRLASGNRVKDPVIIRMAQALGVKASEIIRWEQSRKGEE
jgi:transcriptional regulator with XRE-family HTH domain